MLGLRLQAVRPTYASLVLIALFGGVAGHDAAAQAGAAASAAASASCVARPNVRRMQIIDAQNILFIMRDKTTFRNSLTRQCSGLRRDSQISLTAADTQVCAGGSFQVMLRVGAGSNSESVLLPGGTTVSVPRPEFIPGPACTLGAFTPITEAEAEALIESSRSRRREERRRDDQAKDAAQ